MATLLEVYNSALVKVGADVIAATTEDNRRTNLIRSVFNAVRDEVLVEHKWNFATKWFDLTPNTNTPVGPYEYEYDIPSDVLQILNTDDDSIEFKVEENKIVTDESTLKIECIIRSYDYSIWTPQFVQALAWRLAKEIAYALTQSHEREAQCERSYRDALTKARSTDGAEGTLKGLVADDWTNIRR